MIGIYSIRNTVDNKRYIGKSKDIDARIKVHKSNLKKDTRSRDVNRHLFNAVKKYGLESYVFEVLEVHDVLDEAVMKGRELFFMDLYNTCNRDYGYNLRRDSSTSHTVHEETRKIISEANTGEKNPNYGNAWTLEQRQHMSDIKTQQFKDGIYAWMLSDENKAKLSLRATTMWQDSEKKDRMARLVGMNRSELYFLEYDKHTLAFKRKWDSMQEILDNNPDYHRIAIYSVCNGHKKSYRGSVWESYKKELQ